MANFVRTAKSASKWTGRELLAFNISIVPAGLTAFFGIRELPHSPFANNVVLNEYSEPANMDGLSEDEAGFFFHLDTVDVDKPVEPAVGDLAAFLLRFCNFSSRELFIRQRPILHFKMSEKRVNAIPNVALVDRCNHYFLLVQEDKIERRLSEDPEAQLIAEAIAASHENRENLLRVGLTPPKQQFFPAILMLATAPVFYKIVVTEKLSRCVSQGTYPSEKTVVQRYVPPVPEQNLYPHGMRLLENRCAAFQSLEALKSLIPQAKANLEGKTPNIVRRLLAEPRVPRRPWRGLARLGRLGRLGKLIGLGH